jgi:hypothetical protein
MVSVDAPCRISIKGQSRFCCCAPTTVCGDFADESEKKLDILSFREGVLDDGEPGEAGVDEGSVAVVAGVPRPPPAEHPDASSASASKVAINTRSPRRIR